MNKTLAIVVEDGSKPYGFMPKNRACSLEFYLKQSTKKRQKDTTYAII